MNDASHRTIELAKALGQRGLTIGGLEIHTPDGRTWQAIPIPAGRGRFADGHWGPKAGARGGFRLFEFDQDQNTGPDEHDCPDGDTWALGDLIDYLNAVGQPPAKTATRTPPLKPAETRASLFYRSIDHERPQAQQ